MPDRVSDILQQLQSSGFHGIEGTRIGATIPVSEELLNRIVSAALTAGAPVRSVTVQPEPGDRLAVRIVPRHPMLPAITLKLEIESQPQFPDTPVLVLRMATLSGLFGLAGGAIAGFLPPGVRLDGERILVDLPILAAQRGQAAMLRYVNGLTVHTEGGRLIVHADLGVARNRIR